jgi:protocatechuate 3,4-dioxygenase beta subunit
MIRLVLLGACLAAAGVLLATAVAAVPTGSAASTTTGTTGITTGTTGTTGTTPTTTSACPATNKPNDLKLVAGSPQTARIGSSFGAPFQVRLANRNGCPLTGSLSGVSVTFSAPSSGASGTFASTGSNTATVGTDGSGVAAAPEFTASSSEGDYEVTASSRYGNVTFHLTNTATGVAASVAAAGQADQSATVKRQYAQPLQARVLDAHGAALPGAAVTFSLGTGPSGASASFVGGGPQATVQTDAGGTATSPPFVANDTAGPFSASASVGGVSTLATYTLDNHAAVYTLGGAGTATQTASITSRYAAPLKAQVLDEAGKPVEGATVTFTLGTGTSGAGAGFVGGGAEAARQTDSSGVATSPAFVANGMPGRFSATATVPGGTAPLGYSMRNLAGRLAAGAPASDRARVNGRYAHRLRARMLGANGKPLDGIAVSFAIAKGASGATAVFLDGTGQATATTNASGWATSPPLVANNVAGRFDATASAAATGAKPVAYTLQNVAAVAASITAGSAAGEATTVGTRFPIRLAVTVLDKDDNPVVGATVVFTAPAHGASGRFSIRRQGAAHKARKVRIARVKTNANGIAIAPPFTANGQADGFAVTAAVAGRRTAFALVNKP